MLISFLSEFFDILLLEAHKSIIVQPNFRLLMRSLDTNKHLRNMQNIMHQLINTIFISFGYWSEFGCRFQHHPAASCS